MGKFEIIPEPVEGYQARDVDRVRVGIGTLLHIDGEAHAFAVYNLSTAGFMGECVCDPPLGALLAIELPPLGTIEAKIRWSLEGKCGGQFTTPIPVEDCRRAILPEAGQGRAAFGRADDISG